MYILFALPTITANMFCGNVSKWFNGRKEFLDYMDKETNYWWGLEENGILLKSVVLILQPAMNIEFVVFVVNEQKICVIDKKLAVHWYLKIHLRIYIKKAVCSAFYFCIIFHSLHNLSSDHCALAGLVDGRHSAEMPTVCSMYFLYSSSAFLPFVNIRSI